MTMTDATYTSTTRDGDTLTIYWDGSDPSNPGWAYRLRDAQDSGPIDDLDDLQRVLRDHRPEGLDGLPPLSDA